MSCIVIKDLNLADHKKAKIKLLKLSTKELKGIIGGGCPVSYDRHHIAPLLKCDR